MTRRDFELLSAALRTARPARAGSDTAPLLAAQHRADCEAIANAISARDPNFDRARFMRDSGAAP